MAITDQTVNVLSKFSGGGEYATEAPLRRKRVNRRLRAVLEFRSVNAAIPSAVAIRVQVLALDLLGTFFPALMDRFGASRRYEMK